MVRFAAQLAVAAAIWTDFPIASTHEIRRKAAAELLRAWRRRV
jgi:hypothetical protein